MYFSTCFVHHLTSGRDKIFPQLFKCVFVGCHRFKKGYCCFSPDIHMYSMSVDVSFFKYVAYYTTIHSTDDICSHFPTTIYLPSSSLDSFAITQDAFPTPLEIYQSHSQPIDIPVRDSFLTDNDIVEYMPNPSPTLSLKSNLS